MSDTNKPLSPRELVAFERYVLASVATSKAFALRDPATMAELDRRLAAAREIDLQARTPVFCGKAVA